jgi:uncharacterized protein (DUF433 family)
MTFTPESEPPPLGMDEDGVIRIGETRISLDTVIFAYNEGATPEEIVQDYPTLQLSDVYRVISYYLQHISEIDAYLEERKVQREKIRQITEERFDSQLFRNRLLARRRKAS